MATHSSILAWEFHAPRSLAGYSPWGHKESGTTEWLNNRSINFWNSLSYNFLKQKAQKTTTMDVERYFIEKLGLQPHHIFWIDVIESMPNWSWNINHYLENDLKKIFLNRKWFILPKNIAMKNYIVLDLDILEVSSTMARQAIKTKQSVDSILSLPVRDFVLNNKMYA